MGRKEFALSIPRWELEAEAFLQGRISKDGKRWRDGPRVGTRLTCRCAVPPTQRERVSWHSCSSHSRTISQSLSTRKGYRHRRTDAARRRGHAHHLHQRRPSGRHRTHHRRVAAVEHQRVAKWLGQSLVHPSLTKRLLAFPSLLGLLGLCLLCLLCLLRHDVLFGCWRHALEGAAVPHATSGLLIRLELSAIVPTNRVGN